MESNELHHVFNRGNNRETIFKEPRNYDFFLEEFQKYLIDKVEVHAYCLMPNHFHFLLKVKEVNQTIKLPLSPNLEILEN